VQRAPGGSDLTIIVWSLPEGATGDSGAADVLTQPASRNAYAADAMARMAEHGGNADDHEPKTPRRVDGDQSRTTPPAQLGIPSRIRTESPGKPLTEPTTRLVDRLPRRKANRCNGSYGDE